MTKWDKRYMKIAREVATWSKDPDTQVGSVLVSRKYNSIISVGFNGICRNVEDKPERLVRPEKYLWISHAESSVIDNATVNGARVIDAKLYCTLFPCYVCANEIVRNEIAEVIAPPPNFERIASHYDVSLQMFKEKGIDITYYYE